MGISDKATATFGSGPRRMMSAHRHASRTLRLVLTGAVGMSLVLALSAAAGVGSATAAVAAHARPATAPARRVPDTSIQTRLARVSRSSTVAFRFVSTMRHSTFRCRLDRGPWLACRSPRRYTALLNGRHTFAVRAISPAGREDPVPARVTWTIATPARIQVRYVGTDANGVASYDYTSPDDGDGTHVLRVLAPTHPAPGVPHNFLYVLPVQPGVETTYGDGIETLRSLDAQDTYNLTIIEPSFAVDPWYADNPNVPGVQYETFLAKDLVPWVTQHLSRAGHERNWLIGFSKSGMGAADLLFKHPDVFSVAASWDFPADMPSYNQFGTSSSDEYGTDANFQANYRLTRSFVDSHKTPFLSQNRIWIGSYEVFGSDMADYNALLTSEGIQHTTETPTPMAHRWDSGWVPIALSALSQDSAALAAAAP
jgi:Putative esterase